MRVGIITFYCVANYGAMLQAYALRSLLEGRGHEVVFISLPLLVAQRPALWRCLVSRSLTNFRIKFLRRKKFEMTRFMAGLPHTPMCHNVEDVIRETKDLDAFVVGSDQIWNPMWFSADYLPIVMLDFVENSRLRISYAASFGTKEWPVDKNPEVAGRMLKRFTAVSVREESAVGLVQRLSGRDDVKWVLDPTMMHGVGFYMRLISSLNQNPRKDFIFFFYIDHEGNSGIARQLLVHIQKELKIDNVLSEVKEHGGIVAALERLINVKDIVDVPTWLRRIADSRFVVTNSFHGTVFSILFHRPFVSLLLRDKLSGMNERVVSLLSRIGLIKQAVYADDIAGVNNALETEFDWDRIDGLLGAFRDESLEFINSSGL